MFVLARASDDRGVNLSQMNMPAGNVTFVLVSNRKEVTMCAS
jgi:hypothetical protein